MKFFCKIIRQIKRRSAILIDFLLSKTCLDIQYYCEPSLYPTLYKCVHYYTRMEVFQSCFCPTKGKCHREKWSPLYASQLSIQKVKKGHKDPSFFLFALFATIRQMLPKSFFLRPYFFLDKWPVSSIQQKNLILCKNDPKMI